AFQPDLSVLNPAIVRGNRQLANLPPDVQGVAIIALAEKYAQDAHDAPGGTSASAPPFRVIVNPLVAWIWIGALIALAGAVMAGWPALESRRRLEAAHPPRLRPGPGAGTRA